MKRETTMSIGGVTFTTVQCPDPLPYPIPNIRTIEKWMMDGKSGPGIRAQLTRPLHPSHYDFEFTLGAVSSSQIQSLTNLAATGAAFVFTINRAGGGSTSYRCVFASGGLRPTLPRRVEYAKNIASLAIKLRVLEIQ